jgi:hypothetical protein
MLNTRNRPKTTSKGINYYRHKGKHHPFPLYIVRQVAFIGFSCGTIEGTQGEEPGSVGEAKPSQDAMV